MPHGGPPWPVTGKSMSNIASILLYRTEYFLMTSSVENPVRIDMHTLHDPRDLHYTY